MPDFIHKLRGQECLVEYTKAWSDGLIEEIAVFTLHPIDGTKVEELVLDELEDQEIAEAVWEYEYDRERYPDF